MDEVISRISVDVLSIFKLLSIQIAFLAGSSDISLGEVRACPDLGLLLLPQLHVVGQPGM